LVAWKTRNLSWYESFVDDVTGLIVGTEYNAQTTFSDIPPMVLAQVHPIVINYAIFVNPITINVVKSPQIHSWCYEEIARIAPAQRNSGTPLIYISLVNELS